METRWAGSSPVDPQNGQYIYVDLGQSYSIGKVVLYFEAGSTNYKIQWSVDASSWTDNEFIGNTSTNGTAEITTGFPESARYIRMIAYNTLGTAGVSLYEFEIYGAIISGQFTGSVLDSGPKNNGGIPTGSGVASSTASFTASSGNSTYGSYSVASGGAWSYTLDTTNTIVDELAVGVNVTDTFTISTAGIPRVVTITIWGADETDYAAGQYIQGDGSGGGGGGASGDGVSTTNYGGAGGAGGGSDDPLLAGTAGNDIIFGDGSGGGKGGRGVGTNDYTGTGAGLGGGGADTINGGTGNDIIFGDGFDGTMDTWNAGKGGFGGGGGGGSGGNLGTYLGAIGGLGAGSGSGYAGSVAPLVARFGNTGGSGTTPGGNSATSIAPATGPGGASYGSFNGHGGGGGFGGSSGGAGASSYGLGNVGEDGNTAEHRYNDTGSIHTYVFDNRATILTDYPAYGAGIDTLNGGAGSDHLFGLGGADTFVFELNDAINGNDIDTIWDFNKNSDADLLRLLITGVPINQTVRDALIAAQVTDGLDRKLVFSNGADKQVTIVIKNLGVGTEFDIDAMDFAQ